jgi:hypothetical protein
MGRVPREASKTPSAAQDTQMAELHDDANTERHHTSTGHYYTGTRLHPIAHRGVLM